MLTVGEEGADREEDKAEEQVEAEVEAEEKKETKTTNTLAMITPARPPDAIRI